MKKDTSKLTLNKKITDKKIKVGSEKVGMKGIHRFIMRDAKTGHIISDHTYENVVVTVAKNMIADRLAGGSDDTDITYGAVGTGAGTPAIGDTTLFTENTRKIFASISATGAVVTATTFFGSSEANDTLTEFSMFGNGATGTADSGTMINHVSISEVKTSSETLTIESTLTIS